MKNIIMIKVLFLFTLPLYLYGCSSLTTGRAPHRNQGVAISSHLENGGSRLVYLKGQGDLDNSSFVYESDNQALVEDNLNSTHHDALDVVVVDASDVNEQRELNNHSNASVQQKEALVKPVIAKKTDQSPTVVVVSGGQTLNKQVENQSNTETPIVKQPEPQKQNENFTTISPSLVKKSQPQSNLNTNIESPRDQATCKDVNYCYDPLMAAKYVRETFAINQIDLPGKLPIDIFDECKRKNAVFYDRKPAGGDIVFFHNTESFNHSGKRDDWFTHIGVVVNVDNNDTVTFIGYQPGGLREGKLNLKDKTQDPWRTFNSRLRGGETLNIDDFADHLFAGYCNMAGNLDHFDLIDMWKP